MVVQQKPAAATAAAVLAVAADAATAAGAEGESAASGAVAALQPGPECETLAGSLRKSAVGVGRSSSSSPRRCCPSGPSPSSAFAAQISVRHSELQQQKQMVSFR